MAIFRVPLLSLLMLALVGCATFNKKPLPEDKYGSKCNHPSPHIFKITTKDVKQNSSEKSEFYESTPTKVFSGIKSANIADSTATISVFSKGYYEQYSAPLIETIREKHREAKPGLGLFSTVLMLGLYPVLAYNDFSEVTFGCTDKTFVMSEPDSTKKVKTGNSEWTGITEPHKFLVSGFDKGYEFSAETIDLSNAILNTDLTEKTTVKVTCLDCNLLGQEEQDLYKDVKQYVELSADFREVKAKLVAEEKTRKTEQAHRDKEAAIQRVIDAKEVLERRKEAQGVPLNEFKAQCQSLGFKLGSEEYGNCVLELNDAK